MKQISLALPRHCVNTNFPLRCLEGGKRIFNEGGVSNLQSYSRQRNPELDAAMEEIRLLKNIVAKQSIELEFKTELLKKSQSLEQCRSK